MHLPHSLGHQIGERRQHHRLASGSPIVRVRDKSARAIAIGVPYSTPERERRRIYALHRHVGAPYRADVGVLLMTGTIPVEAIAAHQSLRTIRHPRDHSLDVL